jgi:hypothetical protein
LPTASYGNDRRGAPCRRHGGRTSSANEQTTGVVPRMACSVGVTAFLDMPSEGIEVQWIDKSEPA